MSVVTLVIDMQVDFFAHEELARNRARLVANINRVLGAARSAGAPIAWIKTEHAPDLHDASLEIRSKRINVVVSGTHGARILPELDHQPTDAMIVKKRYSAFFGTALDELLRAKRCSRLVVCGVNTHACVRATVIDAYQRDLDVILAEGCIGSHDVEHHEVSWRYMSGKLATALPVDQLVALLAGNAS